MKLFDGYLSSWFFKKLSSSCKYPILRKIKNFNIQMIIFQVTTRVKTGWKIILKKYELLRFLVWRAWHWCCTNNKVACDELKLKFPVHFHDLINKMPSSSSFFFLCFKNGKLHNPLTLLCIHFLLKHYHFCLQPRALFPTNKSSSCYLLIIYICTHTHRFPSWNGI